MNSGWALMLGRIKRLEELVPSMQGGERAVDGGADYVHLGPTPAVAVAAPAGGQRRQQQQAAKNVQLKAATAAVMAAAPWTEVVNGGRRKHQPLLPNDSLRDMVEAMDKNTGAMALAAAAAMEKQARGRSRRLVMVPVHQLQAQSRTALHPTAEALMDMVLVEFTAVQPVRLMEDAERIPERRVWRVAPEKRVGGGVGGGCPSGSPPARASHGARLGGGAGHGGPGVGAVGGGGDGQVDALRAGGAGGRQHRRWRRYNGSVRT